jgi:nucleoside-diphosphate-sugar epimerase
MKKALITGATGFIGCRLAEIACERKIPVVGLVRNWSGAARLARLSLQMSSGDLLRTESLRKAMQGCDVVFHCAVDNRLGGRAHWRSSVAGTENVMKAALQAGVKRIVYLSSAAVYGYHPAAETTTETAPDFRSDDAYCKGKIESEKVALRYHQRHGSPVSILRPTIVYGPFAPLTQHLCAAIRGNRVVLVNGGHGVFNGLYVDNLVEAMLLAAEHDDAVGQVFTLSDAHPATWKEFVAAHARALKLEPPALPEMTRDELAATRRQLKSQGPLSFSQAMKVLRSRETREPVRSIPVVNRSVQLASSVARSLLPARADYLLRTKLLRYRTLAAPNGIAQNTSGDCLSRAEEDMFSAFDEVTFRIDKARGVLAYDPKISFADGMKRTTQWIQWARL